MSEINSAKRTCNKIGTHNGKFHCDEVLACYLLKQLPQYKNSTIIRSRDPKELDDCDIVVDVGGVYDAAKYRFDHHQRTFTETFASLNPTKKWTIKLSSAGLIYVHFGKEVIENMLNTNFEMKFDSDKDKNELVEIMYDKIYEGFVMEIDAIDNGINIADEPRYSISTNLSARVGCINPEWNDVTSDENDQFHKAIELVGSEFAERVKYYSKVWWPARSIVKKAIETRFELDPSGAIIKLDSTAPWKSHLFLLEKDMNINDGEIKYALFGDQSGQSWRIQCVPVNENSFTNRLSIKEEWRGVRDEDLSKLSGIPDCIFVHASGFIGGAKTFQGALEMAKQSLK